jgi:uncharacterized protein (TIGR03067 family)
VTCSILLAMASGCASHSQSSAASAPTASSTASANVSPSLLEGSWTGREITPGRDGSATLVFSGQNLVYHGPDADDWLKGTFVLREDTNPKQFIGTVTECGDQDAVGKKCYVIYKIEDGTLTVAGNAPGNPNAPSSFDAPDARQFVFKHTQ